MGASHTVGASLMQILFPGRKMLGKTPGMSSGPQLSGESWRFISTSRELREVQGAQVRGAIMDFRLNKACMRQSPRATMRVTESLHWGPH